MQEGNWDDIEKVFQKKYYLVNNKSQITFRYILKVIWLLQIILFIVNWVLVKYNPLKLLYHFISFPPLIVLIYTK